MTVVNLDCLYTAEAVASKGILETEIKERRFVRKILIPRKQKTINKCVYILFKAKPSVASKS